MKCLPFLPGHVINGIVMLLCIFETIFISIIITIGNKSLQLAEISYIQLTEIPERLPV